MPSRRKGDDPRAELWGWGSTMGTTVQTGVAGLAETFRERFQSCCFIFWQGCGQIFLASSLLCVLPAKISPDYLHQAFTKCLKGQIQASWDKGQGEPPLLRARVNTGLTISSQTPALGSCLPPLALAQGFLKPKGDVARISQHPHRPRLRGLMFSYSHNHTLYKQIHQNSNVSIRLPQVLLKNKATCFFFFSFTAFFSSRDVTSAIAPLLS